MSLENEKDEASENGLGAIKSACRKLSQLFAFVKEAFCCLIGILLIIALIWKLCEVGMSILPESYEILGLGELKLGEEVDMVRHKLVSKQDAITHQYMLAHSELEIFTIAGWHASPKSLRRYAVFYRGEIDKPEEAQRIEDLLIKKYSRLRETNRVLTPFWHYRLDGEPCDTQLLKERDWHEIFVVREEKRHTVRSIGIFLRKKAHTLFPSRHSYEVMLMAWDAKLMNKAEEERKEKEMSAL